MMQLLVLAAAFGIGAAIGLLLGRRVSRVSARSLAISVAVVIGTPVALFVLANLLDSDTLGMLVGLSLMVLFALAVPIGLGIAAGLALARRGKTSVEPVVALEPMAPPVDVEPPPTMGLQFTRHQLGVLLAAAGVPAALWITMTVGFWLNEEYTPVALNVGFLPAVLVLVAAIVITVRHAREHWSMSMFSLPRIELGQSREWKEYRAWLASMAADPRRRRYASEIDAGNMFWTPERVEYDLDRDATTCCAHLAPIEIALRRSGLDVQMDAVGGAKAPCRIDVAKLQQYYAPPPSVGYREYETYDRTLDEHAEIACSECNSQIRVLHPNRAGDAPIFPAVT